MPLIASRAAVRSDPTKGRGQQKLLGPVLQSSIIIRISTSTGSMRIDIKLLLRGLFSVGVSAPTHTCVLDVYLCLERAAGHSAAIDRSGKRINFGGTLDNVWDDRNRNKYVFINII